MAYKNRVEKSQSLRNDTIFEIAQSKAYIYDTASYGNIHVFEGTMKYFVCFCKADYSLNVNTLRGNTAILENFICRKLITPTKKCRNVQTHLLKTEKVLKVVTCTS